MEQTWIFEKLAVSVFGVDFWDPSLADQPDARERGVRLEVRPVATEHRGSVYSSPTQTLLPALCRVDLLESQPGAADRMHWHPEMADGEPGQRVFDVTMPEDPRGWLRTRMRDLGSLLAGTGQDAQPYAGDMAAVAERADEIVTVADRILARARQPWPEVERDDRGLAPIG